METPAMTDAAKVNEEFDLLDGGDAFAPTLSAWQPPPPPISRANSAAGRSKGSQFEPFHHQTCGVVHLPLELDTTTNSPSLSINSNETIQSHLFCQFPPTRRRWHAKVKGSTLVRGPMGAASGSLLVGREVWKYTSPASNSNHQSRRLQTLGQVTLGDVGNWGTGLRLVNDGDTKNTHSWYEASILWYARNIHIPRQETWALLFQSYQTIPKTGQLQVQCVVPPMLEKSRLRVLLDTTSLWFPSRLSFQWSRRHPTLSLSLCTHKNKQKRQYWFRFLTRGFVPWQCQVYATQPLGSSLASLGMGLRYHFVSGNVSWLWTWTRGHVKIRIPILISAAAALDRSQQYGFHSILYSLVLATVSTVVQEIVTRIWYPNRLADYDGDDEPQRQHRTQQQQRMEAAKKQQQLMRTQASRHVKAEQKTEGLVITRAVYYSTSNCNREEQTPWDVTIPLQFWTSKSRLELPAGPKQDLLGFYDIQTAAGKKSSKHQDANSWVKRIRNMLLDKTDINTTEDPITASSVMLAIQYDYGGESYEITFQDQQAVRLPSHYAKVVPVSTVVV